MKVGAIQIMEPTSSGSNDAKRWGSNGNPSSARWWTCDLGNQGDPSEQTANGSKDTGAPQPNAKQSRPKPPQPPPPPTSTQSQLGNLPAESAQASGGLVQE